MSWIAGFRYNVKLTFIAMEPERTGADAGRSSVYQVSKGVDGIYFVADGFCFRADRWHFTVGASQRCVGKEH